MGTTTVVYMVQIKWFKAFLEQSLQVNNPELFTRFSDQNKNLNPA